MVTIENIINYVHKYNRVYIYGAGEIGKFLLDVLRYKKIQVEAFIVSDDQIILSEVFDGLPIVKLSACCQDNSLQGCGILVAVSSLYRSEVIDNLKEKGIVDYLLVACDALNENMREIHPVEPEKFLLSINPVSREFGIERGKPLDRVYIERFLEKAASKLPNVSKILEVGSDDYSKKYFFDDARMIQYDVLRHDKGEDLTDEKTLLRNYYDVFICTQVFNFIYDVKAAIRGAYYLLKPGGTMLATVQGCVGQVSRTDMKLWGDYWRFTALGIGKLVSEVFGEEYVKIYPHGNAAVATAFIQGLAWEDLADISLFDKVESEYAINIGIIATKKG